VCLLAACQPASPAAPALLEQTTTSTALPETALPTTTQTASPAPRPTLLPTPTATLSPQTVGPDSFPAGINPLTGLPAGQADWLEFSPGLVSISNSPITTRPQTGLSYASIVYEMYIGEGASRFLAVFYGDFPPEEICAAAGDCQPVKIGPIRSGRMPYESLREMLRGYLVFGSASQWVMPHLEERNVVYGQAGADDPNTAFITPRELKEIGADTVNRRGRPAPLGLRFDPQPPEGGQPGTGIWLPYHYTDQIFWRYDPAAGSYLRSQGDQDGTRVAQLEDRLTGEPLQLENVVVLFADHRFYTGTFFDIDLLYITRLPALVFRDGQVYKVWWTTANKEYERSTGRLRPLRLVDSEGNPFPLKNGHTWMMFVPLYTAYNETVESFVYRELQAGSQPGSGNWAFHFQVPAVGIWPSPTPPP
jgi:hypothetical protein